MDATRAIRDKITRLDHESEAARQRLVRIDIERSVLRDLLKEMGEDSSAKLGPKEAVLRAVAEYPGVTPDDIVQLVEKVVSTPPEKINKTIKQTIRNLDGKELRIEAGSVFLSKNGHGA